MSNKQEVVFADGLMFNLPREGAPSFVKGRLSVKVENFIKFIQANVKPDGFVNINLKVSKGGKAYAVLDTWVPNQGPKTSSKAPEKKEVNVPSDSIDYPEEDIDPDDIPF